MANQGEYTAGRGTPARRHDKSSKQLTVGETARVARSRALEEGQNPYPGATQEQALKRASVRTNKYSDESGAFGEKV